MEEENNIHDNENRIKNNFRIWILTYSPSCELIVKKWYDNFILCSLNDKISYLKLITKLVEMKRNNLKVVQTIFFEVLDMAFRHVSKLANDNSKLFSMLTQVTLEWNHKNIFTSTQIKKLQDIIISRSSNNNAIEEYHGTLPLRIAIHKKSRLELKESVDPITVTKLNFSILKNQVILLKGMVIDLHANYTKEKYYAIKSFFQATLQNIEEVGQENLSSLDVNRNLLTMIHKIIKDSERET